MKNAFIILAVVVLVAGVAFYKSTQTESPVVAPEPGNVALTSATSAAETVKPAVAEKTPQPQSPAQNDAPVAPGTLCPEPPPSAAAPSATQGAPPPEQVPPAIAVANRTGEPPPTAPQAPAPAGPSDAAPALASAPATSSTAKLPRVVDLGAGKCKACKDLAPILEELKKEYAGRMDVEFIDVWKNKAAGEPYKIRVIPTQVFFDRDGKEVWRHEGFLPKADFIAKFAELGVK